MTKGNNFISEYDNPYPQLPYILHAIEVGIKGNKNTYLNSVDTGNIALTNIQHLFQQIFQKCKKYSPSVYQHFIQFKLL